MLRLRHFTVLAFATGLAATSALAADSPDQATIRALRAESNRAIAAHDLKAFLPVFAEDAAFVWSNGSSASGRSGLAARFAEDFADPAFIRYVRTPAVIQLSDTGARAVEHGTWEAFKTSQGQPTRYGGDYTAHWARTPTGWRIRGELYVKLRCEGPLCTP
jgi:uncharacterized protein (TIGR02246 family)